MPHLSGSDVLKEMKADDALKEIPVIVKTTVDESTEAEVLKLGADDFVFSPMDPTVVKKRVNNLVQKYILERAMMKKEIEEEKRRGRVRESLIAQISEELRTPIHHILEMAGEGTNAAENMSKMRELFLQIHESGEYLLSMAEDIVEISERDREEMAIHEAPFHLDSVVCGISNEMHAKCKEKGIEFSFEITNVTHEELIGDARKLGQVWRILLENAYKYTACGGYLRTNLFERKIGEQEVELVITVQDDGGERNLPIVRSIVELMGGTVTVGSTSKKGATFMLRLPYKYVKEQEKKDKKFNMMKALVYDENELTCNYHTSNLSRLGMRCEVAENSDMAVRMLREAYANGQKYDVFFINWYMKDGKKTVQKVREWFDRDTLLIVSASGEVAAAEAEMRKTGVDYILERPVLQSTIYQLMAEICKNRN